jgi:hypothetical protein
MNCNPTLTAEEFKSVHNGMCHLAAIIGEMEDTIHPQLLQRLLKAKTEIADGLQSAYAQDEAAFERKSAHYDRIREELGLATTWSIYKVDDLGERYPYQGAKSIVYTNHWGDKDAVRVEINGLTWAALYVAANAAIRDSGDTHHTYIEDFKPSKDDATVLVLTTGS